MHASSRWQQHGDNNPPYQQWLAPLLTGTSCCLWSPLQVEGVHHKQATETTKRRDTCYNRSQLLSIVSRCNVDYEHAGCTTSSVLAMQGLVAPHTN